MAEAMHEATLAPAGADGGAYPSKKVGPPSSGCGVSPLRQAGAALSSARLSRHGAQMPCSFPQKGVRSTGSMSARANALQRNAEGNAEHLRGQRSFLEAALQTRVRRRPSAVVDAAGEPVPRSAIGDRLDQLLSNAYENAEEVKLQKAHLKEIQELRARQAAEKKAQEQRERERPQSLVPPLSLPAPGPENDQSQAAEASSGGKRGPTDSTEPTAKEGCLSSRLRAIEAMSMRNAKDMEAHREFLDQVWARRRKQEEEIQAGLCTCGGSSAASADLPANF